ncbi:MAG: DUF4880 domain-containing protein, partial [Ectothiorhodospiraceae bacterium]|nr:DUF4880 domain-containing protein [Ectothiorhodospiraceae bacterium]
MEDAAQEALIRVTDPDGTVAQLAAFQDWYQADRRHQAAYDEQEALWVALGDFEPAFRPAR